MEGQLDDVFLRLKESTEKQAFTHSISNKAMVENLNDLKETVLSEIKLNTNCNTLQLKTLLDSTLPLNTVDIHVDKKKHSAVNKLCSYSFEKKKDTVKQTKAAKLLWISLERRCKKRVAVLFAQWRE